MMETKPAAVLPASASATTQSQSLHASSILSGICNMKRTPSELALEEFLNKTVASTNDEDVKPYELWGQRDKSSPHADSFLAGVGSDYFDHAFRNSDAVTAFSTCEELTDSLVWPQNATPKHSPLSATIESQSSICGTAVCSPVSANNQPTLGDTQAKGTTTSASSSREQSDEDDVAGPCDQSTNPIDMKRLRRKFSNRESARRSRRRKQAHLADIELQVEQLRLENAALYKQLTDASQQFREANTNNRVLKSDVEAFRAKVKLAEDMVTRGSFSTLNNPLVQNQSQLQAPPQLNATSLQRRMAHVSPTITVHGSDASYAAVAVDDHNSSLGLANLDISNSNFNTGVISDAMRCISEIYR